MNMNLILKAKEAIAKQQGRKAMLILEFTRRELRLENYYLYAYLWYLFIYLAPCPTDNLGRNDGQLRTTPHQMPGPNPQPLSVSGTQMEQ